MTPKKLTTRQVGPAQAKARRVIGATGIAAGDTICIAASGERYAGQDHAAAATLLERVDPAAGKRLRQLVGLKPGSHYGEGLLSDADRKAALRCAAALVEDARTRTL